MGLRRVWRYQRGNQNPLMEKEQTTQSVFFSYIDVFLGNILSKNSYTYGHNEKLCGQCGLWAFKVYYDMTDGIMYI
jgi:hypothetical protein